ncbi:MAG: hypothetical protein HC781_10585 [Leptolyngbyaceae cyanobacterium CSU_1_4]|nr:hypothetical protein [Leptolyngbyaceae cyanobacterium CSU_1_4]
MLFTQALPVIEQGSRSKSLASFSPDRRLDYWLPHYPSAPFVFKPSLKLTGF